MRLSSLAQSAQVLGDPAVSVQRLSETSNTQNQSAETTEEQRVPDSKGPDSRVRANFALSRLTEWTSVQSEQEGGRRSERDLPLAGIRVADFSWLAAGPWCTSLMAQMGAEVIRVESRRKLDICRTTPGSADDIPGVNRGCTYNLFNIGKKGCTLNLATAAGQKIARQLVEVSDVVVENFAFGFMERVGLAYSDVKRIKSDIVMLSICGMGHTGPLRESVCYGNTLHAYSGLNSLTGYPDGQPRAMGGTWADPLTAMTATLAVLAALFYRSLTGEGQYIDMSQCEPVMVQLPEALMDYEMNGRVRKPIGNRHEWMAPHGLYQCQGKDKWVAIAVSSDEEWAALCRAIGNPDWCQRAEFQDGYARWRNQDEMNSLIEAWTRGHSHYEVMEVLQRAGVPAGACLDAAELVSDPHLRARGRFIEVDHPEIGTRPALSVPWKISGVPCPNYDHAPMLGEHNRYVFVDLLGMSEDQMAQLIEEKVVW